MVRTIDNITTYVDIIKMRPDPAFFLRKERLMNKKNNKRYQENEVRMESAMLELLQKKDLNKITVKNICEKAGVNRTTFYSHFLDVYDMLDKMEAHLRDELLESYAGKSSVDRTIFSEPSLRIFLEHIKRHQYFYRIQLANRRSFPLKQGFEPLWDQVVKPSCLEAGITDEDDMMYYFVYFQAGFTMVLRRWVEDGCRKSEDEITELIAKCIPPAFRNLRK